MQRLMLALLLTLVAAGCYSGGRSGGGDSDPNLILADEIRNAGSVRTAYDAVRFLRPHIVRVRGQTGLGSGGLSEPVVYIDGIRAGGLDELRRITASDVLSIRYYDSRDATTRFGIGHDAGAIEVKLTSG